MKSKDRAAQEPKLLKLKAALRRTSTSPIPSWSVAATVVHSPHRALHRCLVVASGALVSTTTPITVLWTRPSSRGRTEP
jgi:hypothetical protein